MFWGCQGILPHVPLREKGLLRYVIRVAPCVMLRHLHCIVCFSYSKSYHYNKATQRFSLVDKSHKELLIHSASTNESFTAASQWPTKGYCQPGPKAATLYSKHLVQTPKGRAAGNPKVVWKVANICGTCI